MPETMFGGEEASAAALERLSTVYDVPVQLSVVLGRATMRISDLVQLTSGAEIELDRRVGEPVDILINNRLVARGKITVIDERLGVSLTELVNAR